jgi:exopolyphosphatase/pppGpp-phosphohydrolase
MELVNNMTEQEKINNPMIGPSRIKLLENGIKILKLILNIFKVKSIFVSDRGIKEGMIWNKINENNYL